MSARGITLEPSSANLFKFDGPAGTVVFLVALPLCLGIALASGAPLFAGLIAGIVGGILVSILSGSEVSVSGPAAGLTVIVFSAIQSTGSFPAFLLAVVIAGVAQILLALIRAGVAGDYVPNSVIRGMLAAIVLVIILKQIPHALGRDRDYVGDFSFLEHGSSNTLTEILEAVASFSGGAVAIAALSLAVLLLWEKAAARENRFFRIVPAPLVVVALGIGLNELFRWLLPSLHLSSPDHLVSLPVASSLKGFWGQFTFPDFSSWQNRAVWQAGFTIAIVASIETLLSLEAADKLDRFRRISPPNRELFAQGFGNIVSGLIGGLPMTSVVVRTSANVYAGSRTWVSSFVHGTLLLVSALAVPGLLNKIPLACLAAILIVIGFKLTKPEIYREQRSYGYEQFIPFLVTVVAIVFTDLLSGVMVGMAFGLFFVIRSNHHRAFTVVHQDNYYLMRFNKDATFVNKAELKAQLRAIPKGATLIIDGTRALYIDHDVREVVSDFQKSAEYKDISIQFRNFYTRGAALKRLEPGPAAAQAAEALAGRAATGD